jgi:hypothetical protein
MFEKNVFSAVDGGSGGWGATRCMGTDRQHVSAHDYERADRSVALSDLRGVPFGDGSLPQRVRPASASSDYFLP